MPRKPKPRPMPPSGHEHIVTALLTNAYELFRQPAPDITTRKENVIAFHLLAHCVAAQFEKDQHKTKPEKLVPALPARKRH